MVRLGQSTREFLGKFQNIASFSFLFSSAQCHYQAFFCLSLGVEMFQHTCFFFSNGSSLLPHISLIQESFISSGTIYGLQKKLLH